MKNVYLIAVLTLLSATVALAQEQEEAQVDKKPSCSGFVTNKFWDNWEISVGGGTGTVLTNHPDYGPHKDRFGWNADLSVSKWFHPVFGARIQARYGEYHNFTSDMERVRWGSWYLNGAFLVNFSNWVGGYREDRVYYAVPYLSAGYYGKNFKTRGAFAVGAGLLNKFRVCPQVDINLVIENVAAPAREAPVTFNARVMYTATASVGITYRFRERTFKRGAAGYTTSQIESLKEEIASNMAIADAAAAENRKLKTSLAAAEKKADDYAAELEKLSAATPDCPVCPVGDVVIFFDRNVSVLSAKDMTRLDILAEAINESDGTFAISGYADAATGTAEINTKLSEQRAKNVYDYLIKRGVSADRLTYGGKFDPAAEPYPGKVEANRAAFVRVSQQ